MIALFGGFIIFSIVDIFTKHKEDDDLILYRFNYICMDVFLTIFYTTTIFQMGYFIAYVLAFKKDQNIKYLKQ